MKNKYLLFGFILILFVIAITFSWWQSASLLFDRVEEGVYLEGVNIEKTTRPQLEEIVAELSKLYQYEATDAVYNSQHNTIVPGLCGCTIDQEQSVNNCFKAERGSELKLVKTFTQPTVTLKNYPKAVVRKGNPQKKSVTLLINVDWGIPEPLESFLQVLKSYNVNTTFCVTGRIMDLHGDIIAKIAYDGHEISSHGYHHHGSVYNYHQMTEEQFAIDLEKTEKALAKSVDTKMVYYSPPSGIINDRLLNAASARGYRTVLWTEGLDTVDWREPPPQTIVNKIKKNITNGGIILMHPKEVTLEALPTILEWLQEEGYQVVPLRELLSPYLDCEVK